MGNVGDMTEHDETDPGRPAHPDHLVGAAPQSSTPAAGQSPYQPQWAAPGWQQYPGYGRAELPRPDVRDRRAAPGAGLDAAGRRTAAFASRPAHPGDRRCSAAARAGRRRGRRGDRARPGPQRRHDGRADRQLLGHPGGGPLLARPDRRGGAGQRRVDHDAVRRGLGRHPQRGRIHPHQQPRGRHRAGRHRSDHFRERQEGHRGHRRHRPAHRPRSGQGIGCVRPQGRDAR